MLYRRSDRRVPQPTVPFSDESNRLVILRHPVKCREYPAKAERLVTADELLRFGF